MRPKLQHLLLLMMLVGLGGGLLAGHASAQGTPVAQGITLDFVNLRSGPGVTFETLVIVDPDVVVDVFGRNADATWYQVSTNGQQGWMARTFVGLLSGTPTGLPIVESTTVPANTTGPTSTPAAATTSGDTNGITVSWANLRSGPDVTFSRIAVISRNTPLTITGRTANNVWLKVVVKGQEGWIFRSLVRVDAAVLAALPVASGPTTAVTTSTTPTTPTNNTRPTGTTGQNGMTVYPFGLGGSGAGNEVGDNDTDGRISQFLFTTDAIVYCRDWNGWNDTRTYTGGGIIVYVWQGPVTGVVFYATEAMINATGIPGAQPALIRSESGFALYRLPGGDFQMTGPNRDGSSFNLRWSGCNPSPQTQ